MSCISYVPIKQCNEIVILLLYTVPSVLYNIYMYSASSLKSGFFSFLVEVANSAIISQVCVIES